MNHIPITSRNNRHFRNLEIFIELVNCRRRAGAPGADDCRTGFVAENAATAQKRRKESPIQKRHDNTAGRSIMNRRTDNITVKFRSFVNKFINFVVYNAFTEFGTCPAGKTRTDRFRSDMINFRTDTFLISKTFMFSSFNIYTLNQKSLNAFFCRTPCPHIVRRSLSDILAAAFPAATASMFLQSIIFRVYSKSSTFL